MAGHEPKTRGCGKRVSPLQLTTHLRSFQPTLSLSSSMQLTITLTFNMHGLNDPGKVNRLRAYINFSQSHSNIFLIQEHKLRKAKAVDLGNRLNNRIVYLHMDAQLGYNSLPGDNGIGCGGTATFISHRLENHIASSGSLFRGRLLGSSLETCLAVTSVSSIYMPQMTSWNADSCGKLSSLLTRTCRWIFAGDFNMVKTSSDKSTHCSRLVGEQEKLLWESIKCEFNINNNFHSRRGLCHSWDNGK